MDHPSLTMSLTVQRDVIREIGCNRQFKGRGLLARFLYSNCQHKAGYRKRQTNKIPENISFKYMDHIIELMEVPLEPQVLKLSSDAQTIWNVFYDEIEASMKPGGNLAGIKDWGSKLAGAVARISGLLHYAEHGQQATKKLISVGIVGDSVAIGRYFLDHAFASFGFMKEEPQIESAKKILEYLKQHKPDSFKGRDILRNKNAFKKIEQITSALKLLVKRNYIREKERNTNGYGRPEATTYEVNPNVNTL